MQIEIVFNAIPTHMKGGIGAIYRHDDVDRSSKEANAVKHDVLLHIRRWGCHFFTRDPTSSPRRLARFITGTVRRYFRFDCRIWAVMFCSRNVVSI